MTEEEQEKQIRENWFKDHVATIESFGSMFGEKDLWRIKWNKPGTGIYSSRYLIDHNRGVLSVYGDVGEAVYQWGDFIDIDFLSGIDLHYFCSKCRASSCGKNGKVWDRDKAISYLRYFLKEDFQNYFSYSDIWDDCCNDGIQIEKDIDILIKNDVLWGKLTKEQQKNFKTSYTKYLKTIDISKIDKTDYKVEMLELINKKEEQLEDAIESCSSEFEWNMWLGSDEAFEFFGDTPYEYSDIGLAVSNMIQAHLIGIKMISEGMQSGKFKVIFAK